MEDKERAVIGIDPGSASGNICLLYDSGNYEIIPFKDYTIQEWGRRVSEWSEWLNLTAIVEAVHGFPGMSAVAVTSLMKNVGQIEMAIALSGIPVRYVSPQAWMKFYNVKKVKGETKTEWKKRLREILQQRLPNVVVRTEQADAVLIALYGRCTRV
jgi:hypothetical protein